jgi:hypothetical protein
MALKRRKSRTVNVIMIIKIIRTKMVMVITNQNGKNNKCNLFNNNVLQIK